MRTCHFSSQNYDVNSTSDGSQMNHKKIQNNTAISFQLIYISGHSLYIGHCYICMEGSFILRVYSLQLILRYFLVVGCHQRFTEVIAIHLKIFFN